MGVPGHARVASTNHIALFNLNAEMTDIKQHVTRVNLGAKMVFVPFPHADSEPFRFCEPVIARTCLLANHIVVQPEQE